MMWSPPDPASYNQIVWCIVWQIPEGVVSTYGQIASMIPEPPSIDPEQYRRLGARWVGNAMRQAGAPGIPWHRVINSQGMVSLPEGTPGHDEQRARLEDEGVSFDARGRVDLRRYGWHGPDDAWLAENDLRPPRPLA